jgi:hypothetical protein
MEGWVAEAGEAEMGAVGEAVLGWEGGWRRQLRTWRYGHCFGSPLPSPAVVSLQLTVTATYRQYRVEVQRGLGCLLVFSSWSWDGYLPVDNTPLGCRALQVGAGRTHEGIAALATACASRCCVAAGAAGEQAGY